MIEIIGEIITHSDEEIIAYLSNELTEIRRIYNRATKERAPELLYMTAPKLDEVHKIVLALNRRNEERKLK